MYDKFSIPILLCGDDDVDVEKFLCKSVRVERLRQKKFFLLKKNTFCVCIQWVCESRENAIEKNFQYRFLKHILFIHKSGYKKNRTNFNHFKSELNFTAGKSFILKS